MTITITWRKILFYLPTFLLGSLSALAVLQAIFLYVIGPFEWALADHFYAELGIFGDVLWFPFWIAFLFYLPVESFLALFLKKEGFEALGILSCDWLCIPTLGTLILILLGTTWVVWIINLLFVKTFTGNTKSKPVDHKSDTR